MSDSESESECEHPQVSIMDGTGYCDDCGLQLDETLLNTEIYFSASDTKYQKNPIRCHIRKDTERSLYKDLQIRQIPQMIIERANVYYKKIIENKIYRAKKRKSIVFACTYYAYIDFNETKPAIELAKVFELDKKGISNGIKTFTSVFKNEHQAKYISPLDLIPKIFSDIGIKDYNVYLEDITKIYNAAEASSKIVKTSIPQSVAAGLVYFYLILKKYPITKKEYSKIVHLTEITFTKIATEVADNLGCREKIKL